MTRRTVATILVCVLSAVPTVLSAQPNPIAWQRVGEGTSDIDGYSVNGIDFDESGNSDGYFDTLYAVSGRFFRYSPVSDAWELLCEQAWCGAEHVVVTKEGHLIIGSRAGPTSDGERSIDGGYTWEHDVVGYGIPVLFQSTLPALNGAVFAGNAGSVSWSFEGGAAGSWILGESMGGEPIALAEVVPSENLPDGRLLGGVWNGAVYSDDGGQTWSPSSMQGTNYLAVNSLSFSRDSSHPFGGVAYTGVRNFMIGHPAVYRSDDGGVTWTLVRAFPPGDFDVDDPNWVVVQAGPGKSLYVAIKDDIAGTPPSIGPIVATYDQGDTWTQVADSTNGWGGYAVNVFRMGRDGRLYAGTDRGVWRTVEPVPVANEPEPTVPDETGALLEVAPNPFRDETTVILMLDEPANVRLSVFDLLGREVAVLADRNYSAGTHEIKMDAARTSTGVLFVRALLTPTVGTDPRGPTMLVARLVKLR